MPYILPDVSSPKTSPITDEPSPLTPQQTGSRGRTSPLKPALKLSRSNSSDGSPYIPHPNLREPRRRSYTSPDLVIPSEAGPSSLSSPTKTVRFPTDQDALEGIRIFRKHGKPIHISHPVSGEETATETEGETSSASGIRYNSATAFGFLSTLPERVKRYPATNSHRPPLLNIQTNFASLGATTPGIRAVTHALPAVTARESRMLGPTYEIDKTISSPVPCQCFDPSANVHVESLRCVSTGSTETLLTGSILVRNIAYSKDVVVRFTLDDWVTVSDVLARHTESLRSFPISFFPTRNSPITPGDAAALLSFVNQSNDEWDRFDFIITVAHASDSLSDRTLWLAVRYSVEGGEWWDSNAGKNYKVGFRVCRPAAIVEGHINEVVGGEPSGPDPSNSADSSTQHKSAKARSSSTPQAPSAHRYNRSYPHSSHAALFPSPILHQHLSISLTSYSLRPSVRAQSKSNEFLRPSSWPAACIV